MDDPWRSPWATTDSDKDQKLASPAKSDIAPPPRAFLSASGSPRIPAVVEQSPWGGDDDGFGDWTTAASETPSAQAAWGGGWGASSPNLSSTPRDDILGKSSPIAWPGNVATNRPANAASLRQPSPDPWASDFSTRRASNDGALTPRLVVDAPSPVGTPIDAPGKNALGIETEPVWDKGDVTDAATPIIVRESNSAASVDDNVDGTETVAVEAQTPADEVRISVDSVSQGREYRSSTPSNENSDHEEEGPDSPITSLDEDTRARPTALRKASGKVHELVVKFDGLARAASEERDPLPRSRSKSPLSLGGRDGSADAADFGEFEDADDDDDDDDDETSRAQETPKAEPIDENSDVANLTSPATLPPPATDPLVRATSPIAKFGPLIFEPDLGLVDQLCASAPESHTPADKVDHDLPDHVVNDSFTEISERKTWYRISRLGSSRRHNAADDDNYRRVVWATSTVHDEAIKIVRRWMEEDSIAGRVALGGGIAKTQKNMFGWDSSAEPVALDAVFGRRKSHARASSLQPLQPIAGPTLETSDGVARKTSGPTHRPSGSAGPAVASFGWSNSSPSNAAAPRSRSTLREPASAAAAAMTKAHVPGIKSRGIPAPISLPTQPVALGLVNPAVNQAAAAENEDDDDWGEMVSSPVVSQPIMNGPAMQSLRGPPAPAASEPLGTLAFAGNQPGTTELNDPWGTVDFSVFESGPAPGKTDSDAKAMMANPNPAPISSSIPGALAFAPTPTTTVAGFPGVSTTSSSLGQHPKKPSTTTAGTPLTADNEAALRIIANLPDLSYMLR